MIRLVVALPAEARPLIQYFKLKPPAFHGLFPIYRNDQITLVISGIGKMAAAAATSYVHTVSGEHRNCAWLNVGVAGHAYRNCGQGLLANRIMDKTTGQCWYPHNLLGLPFEDASLVTVDIPETEYPGEMMYDMEAAGYCFAASRSSSSELIHCYKIISDNRCVSTATVTPNRIGQLMIDHLENIGTLLQKLAGFAPNHSGT